MHSDGRGYVTVGCLPTSVEAGRGEREIRMNLKRRVERAENLLKDAACGCTDQLVIYDDEEPPSPCPIHGYRHGFAMLPRVLAREIWLRKFGKGATGGG